MRQGARLPRPASREAAGGATLVPDVDVVVPTVGRPSLPRLLDALAASEGPVPRRIILVDDRRSRTQALDVGRPAEPVASRLRVLPGPGAGPAVARNIGWRASGAMWVAFLDDDVIPAPDWLARLRDDLAGLDPQVAGSQGRVRVPVPRDRRPTDWERNVMGLERGLWITADMAYRRSVLAEVGGFDERFPRAYREDVELALRVAAAGHRLVRGVRRVDHPVRPADTWTSVRLQAGNADDALMLVLHGPGWRRAARVPRGRRAAHLAVTAAGLVALTALAAGRGALAARAGLAWLAGTAELAWHRLRPGPWAAGEVGRMLVTTPLLPPAASLHWVAGLLRAVRLRRRSANAWSSGGDGPVGSRGDGPANARGGSGNGSADGRAGRPKAVLFDRDGTLVADVPYNGDLSRLAPMPGARRAVDRLRRAGVKVGVVSNQSGVARGLVTAEQVEAVNRRLEELLGPFEVVLYCPHGPDEGCLCRKPAPGLVLEAARSLGVDPTRCVVVGDTAADVGAGASAGARPILVPNGTTRPEEVRSAPELAADLETVVDRLVGRPPAGAAPGGAPA